MVIPKCEKCSKGFRRTKNGEEEFCAKCEVDMLPLPENGEQVDREFRQCVEKEYGETSDEKLVKVFGCDDVLNHKSRLLKLKKDLAATNKNDKNQNRKGREVDRILEEHDAVQQKLAELQQKMMALAMVKGSTKCSSPTYATTSPFLPDLKKPRSPEEISPAVQKLIIEVTPNSSSSQLMPPPRLPPLDNAVADLSSNNDYYQPEAQNLESESEDQVKPLHRSNSVQMRIKAFEALAVRRSSSTGTWDRKEATKRKLQF